jgi:hypothetical protein
MIAIKFRPMDSSTNRNANDDRNIMAENEMLEIRLPTIKSIRIRNLDHALYFRNANNEIAEQIK